MEGVLGVLGLDPAGPLVDDRPGVHPVVDEVASELGDRVKFVKVDVDANPATARSYGIRSIPTFAVIRDGEVFHQFAGSRPKASFKAEVENRAGIQFGPVHP